MILKRIIMIGSFPPPAGGAAMVNALIYRALKAADLETVLVDVSGAALAHNRSLAYHARRGIRNLAGLFQARKAANRQATLYLVPDAGAGAWYTAAHVRGVGARCGQIYFHHHSCRYIEEASHPIRWLTERTRHKAVHIFLTEGMAQAFQVRYGFVRYLVASNARFVAQEAFQELETRHPGRLRIGHLSNLCVDKGFFAVADAFDAIRTEGWDADLALAGPILEPAVAERIAELRKSHGERVEHVGPLRGAAKREFYRGLDLFLFPTQFAQEAAPLVIYEALAAGVPVLAKERGVIAEILPVRAGGVCAKGSSFSDFVMKYMPELSDPVMAAARAADVKQLIRSDCAKSTGQYRELLALLGGATASEVKLESS